MNKNKLNTSRSRPERSEKRKFVTGGKELVFLRARITKETKAIIETEAADLGISESLYINAMIATRDLKKIKKILE